MKTNKKLMSIMAISLILIGLGSAVLVGYLSNEVVVSVDVDSPLIMGISETQNGTYTETLSLPQLYGGDTTTFFSRIEDLSSQNVTGYFTITIENSINNVTCADFTSITLNGVEQISGCVENLGIATFSGYTDIATGEVDIDEISMTFNLAVAPASYTIKSQIMTA